MPAGGPAAGAGGAHTGKRLCSESSDSATKHFTRIPRRYIHIHFLPLYKREVSCSLLYTVYKIDR